MSEKLDNLVNQYICIHRFIQEFKKFFFMNESLNHSNDLFKSTDDVQLLLSGRNSWSLT